MPLPKMKPETTSAWEEYLALPETTMAEFIDGEIYMMATPNRRHQKIVMQLSYAIENRIREKGGSCEVYPAPFGVKLFDDKNDTVEPDISVICDKSKLTDAGCTGAPDWVIEIVSPSDAKHDYVDKLKLYLDAGVPEYWIVDPMEEIVTAYHLQEEQFRFDRYTFADRIPAATDETFKIDFAEIRKKLD